jgi:hypothetical protein
MNAGRVGDVVDTETIRLLIARVAHAIDDGSIPASVESYFTSDARVDSGVHNSASVGLVAISRSFADASEWFAATAHFVTNEQILVDVDSATAESYVQRWAWSPDTAGAGPLRPADEVFVAVQLDDLVRTRDGWRIARRRLRRLGTGSVGLGRPIVERDEKPSL